MNATFEEELFYSTLRGRLGQETTGQKRVNDAIENDETEDGEENLVAEALEEDELMPDAAAALGDLLDRLYRQLEERKEQLMAAKC